MMPLSSQYAVVSYALFPSTLSVQSKHDVQMEKFKEEEQKRDRMEVYRLEERLQTEREERNTLELEIQKLRRERELLEEQKDTGGPVSQ